jgi:hypothetical protein
MSCEESTLKKYLSRPGPPIPATSCMLGQIKKGNDGNNYQIVEFNSKSGKSNKWVKCGTASTSCSSTKVKFNTSRNVLPSQKASTKKNSIPTKKVCPPGKILNPLTNRCVKPTGRKIGVPKPKPLPKIPSSKTDRWKPYPFGMKSGCKLYKSKNLNQVAPPYDATNCVYLTVKANNGDQYESVSTNKTFTNNFGTSYIHKWVKVKPAKAAKPAKPAKLTKKVCPPGKVLRVETNRCVKELKKISKMVDGANKKLKQSNSHK